ncbi:hypothetical protein CRM22_010139 [Opisthorchis felineus]|uniref:FMRFamide-activated amiloride-sensitive sodium channel n=1 Tax=Opisthorchis felineus TaxID=147828 RepID=A0A4S2L1I9_OPIFE|nr:hypothetical protein CRM22_010139 [Opisthorchis felineus]
MGSEITSEKSNILNRCELCTLIWQELGGARNSEAPDHARVNNLSDGRNTITNRKITSEISQIIREELCRFCENTTIRGLPRIVRAHSRSLRLLWSALVTILMLGCTICLLFLGRQYLEYNVIHPPRVLRHTSSPFPAVTVCNLRPISPDGVRYLKQRGWKTPRQFGMDLARFTQHFYYNVGRKEDYKMASAAISFAGFLESLPNDEERRKLGYLHEKLIIKCQITYLNGSKYVASPCDMTGRWRKFIHAQYLNCATFEPFAELLAYTTNIELYIYLNDLTEYATCPDCFINEVKSQLSGALIVIHPADYLPDVNDKSINLKPGSLTEIRLSTVENVQKMPPYGRCSHDLPESVLLYGTDYAYSEYACRQATIQNEISAKCGCFSIEFPYHEHAGLAPCSRLPAFVNISSCDNVASATVNNTCATQLTEFLQRMLCKRSVTERFAHGIVPSCTMPCAFYSYEAEQSTSTWPTKVWQLTWLNSSSIRRLGIFNGPEFQIYREAQALLAQGDESAAARLLEQANLLERNLLAVLINRPNFDVRKVEEKEVLSLTSLLSQSGGLFSIWMGLTMIALGEIIEFFMRCFVKAKALRRNRNTLRPNSLPSDGNASITSLMHKMSINREEQPGYEIPCKENHLLWLQLIAFIKQNSRQGQTSFGSEPECVCSCTQSEKIRNTTLSWQGPNRSSVVRSHLQNVNHRHQKSIPDEVS